MEDSKFINHPQHYNREGRKECIVEMLEDRGRLHVFLFDSCNQYKYTYRAGGKKGESEDKDLNKAKWYKDHADTIWSSWNWFQRLVYRIASRLCY